MEIAPAGCGRVGRAGGVGAAGEGGEGAFRQPRRPTAHAAGVMGAPKKHGGDGAVRRRDLQPYVHPCEAVKPLHAGDSSHPWRTGRAPAPGNGPGRPAIHPQPVVNGVGASAFVVGQDPPANSAIVEVEPADSPASGGFLIPHGKGAHHGPPVIVDPPPSTHHSSTPHRRSTIPSTHHPSTRRRRLTAVDRPPPHHQLLDGREPIRVSCSDGGDRCYGPGMR